MLGDVFDPKAELVIREHYHPHWSQAGAIVFITMRTHDSIPVEVLNRWDREKQEWKQRRGFGVNLHWSKSLPALDDKSVVHLKKSLTVRRKAFLTVVMVDACLGNQPLPKS